MVSSAAALVANLMLGAEKFRCIAIINGGL